MKCKPYLSWITQKGSLKKLCKKAQRDQLEQNITFTDLLVVRSIMKEMKIAYLHMIKDRDMKTKFANEAYVHLEKQRQRLVRSPRSFNQLKTI